jgi:hypothetical protein
MEDAARNNDGGFFLSGAQSHNYSQSLDVYSCRLDANGEMYWEFLYDEGQSDNCFTGCEAADGGYAMAGNTSLNMCVDGPITVWKCDSLGVFLWVEHWYPWIGSGLDVCVTPDGGLVVAGYFYSQVDYTRDAILFKLAPEDVMAAHEPQAAAPGWALHPNYPNPFNSTTLISFDLQRAQHVLLDIFDLTGRQTVTVINGVFGAGPHEVLLDAKDFPSGIYVYRLKTSDFEANRKMVVLK